MYALSNPDKMFLMSDKAKESLARFKPDVIADMWKSAVNQFKKK